MEELYVEGVVTHGGAESCVVVCEGGGEALTGARAGQIPRSPARLINGRDAQGTPRR